MGVKLPVGIKRAVTTAPKVAEDVKAITEEVVEAPEDFFEEALEEEGQDAPGASGVELFDEPDNREARLELISRNNRNRRNGTGGGRGGGRGGGGGGGGKPPPEEKPLSGEVVFAPQGKRPPSKPPYQSASIYQQTPGAIDRRKRLEDIAKLQELRERGLLTPDQQMEAVAKMEQIAADQKESDEAEMTPFEARQRAAREKVGERQRSNDPRVFAGAPEESRGGVFFAPGIPREIAEDPERLQLSIDKVFTKKKENSNRQADLRKDIEKRTPRPANPAPSESYTDLLKNPLEAFSSAVTNVLGQTPYSGTRVAGQYMVVDAIAKAQAQESYDRAEDQLAFSGQLPGDRSRPGGMRPSDLSPLRERDPRLRAAKLAQYPGPEGMRLRALQKQVDAYVELQTLVAQEKAYDIILGELLRYKQSTEPAENEAAPPE